MSKIRINELARELEVKPNFILDMLPQLGVMDKKTHSSSLEDDVVLQLRRRVAAGEGRETSADEHPSAIEAEKPRAAGKVMEVVDVAEPARPAVHAEPSPTAQAQEVAVAKEPAAQTAERQAPAAPVRPAFPLRPPLATGTSTPHAPAPPLQAAPLRPRVPVPPIPVAPPRATVAPPSVPVSPASPSMPLAPAASRVPGTAAVIPSRPAPPAARPGQLLSGPRQPLPPGVGEAPKLAMPGAPRPGAVPSIPTPPRPPARPAPPMPGAAVPQAPHSPAGHAQAGHQTGHPMSGGMPLRPPARQNVPGQQLVGQPSARPVVPPRADLVARLARPAMPAAPRPGMPTSRPASPVPGRPIYQGTVRPGQPLMRGPGGPGGPGGYSRPGSPSGPMRGRPMHPTTPLRAEPATLPADPGRRHATKPGQRGTDRRREDEEGRIRPQARRQEMFQPPPIDREITIAEGVTVKELSEKLGIKGNLLVKRLVEKKIFATINQTLDVKLAEELARDFGASTNKLSYEEETTHDIQQTEVDDDREKRPPVVTIMGHVDHGKTSLLDAIRLANVAGGEAGGITQHIGAYHVEKNGKNIVFIDTPGHEAFTRMRARGAKVTDIVVLVVAADDGVMPQTLEAIDHAKAAGVPIIVAINKMDKPGATPERIKQQLADRNLLAEDWGGDTVMVPVSAKAKTGLETLLEMILLVAEMQTLRANPARPAMGTVLEAKLDRGRGPVATVLVRNGTLKVGDYFICGSVFGRVRAMFDDSGAPTREVGPSMPAEVLGLESLPEVGDTLQVVTDTAKAKQIVIYREAKLREQAMAKTNRITLDQLHDQLKEGETKELYVILKTDVGGTAEVLTDTLQKLSNDRVRIRVLHSGVGAITETDVLLASASNAIIVGFNVRPERTAQATAEHEKVDIRLHTIIYELADEIKKAMTGMLEPVFKEVYKGRALVRDVFRISKVGAVAGCVVDDGVVTRNGQVRLLRDGKVVHTGKIEGLKRFKNDASEVKAGFECGISLAGYNDLKPGDILEAFVIERVAVEAIV